LEILRARLRESARTRRFNRAGMPFYLCTLFELCAA
jgi:hypothetical protein